MKLFESYLLLRCRSLAKHAKHLALCLSVWIGIGAGDLMAQGPGGVLGNLEVWLKANTGFCPTNNCNAGTWLSEFPANLDATVNGTTLLRTGTFNFNPVLDFDNDNDEAYLAPRPTANDFTIFVVFGTNNTVNPPGGSHWRTHPTILNNEINGPTVDYGLTLDQGRVAWYKQAGSGNTRVLLSTNTASNAQRSAQLVSIVRDVTSTDVTMRLNGVQDGPAAGEAGDLSPSSGSVPNPRVEFFGSANASPEGDLQGYLAEVIYFGREVTGTQQTRVESYLALKYGITKLGDYLNSAGTTVYTPAGYGNQIIGVIEDPNSLLDQRQSIPAGFPTGFSMYLGTTFNGTYPTENINNPNNAGPGRSLVIGQDNNSVIFNTAYQGVANARIGRTFRATDVGGVGPVTLNFNNTTYSGFLTGRSYTLVYSTDPTFATGNTFVPLRENGSSASYRCEHDFPDDLTFYFTILDGSHIGPGGIGFGLEAWYKTDTAVTNHAAVSTWRDVSGRGKDLTNSQSGSTSIIRGGVNFNHVLDLPPLNRQFSTSSGVISQTLYMVSRLEQTGATNEGVMGFNNNEGVLIGASQTLSNSNDGREFQDGAGELLRVNGNTFANPTQPAFNNSWMVGSFFRGSTNPSQNFHLGGFDGTNSSPDGLNFGEVIIYSKDLSNTVPMNKVESYLAMKYGVTLAPTNNYYASNWTGSVGTTVYTSPGFGSNVTVIGRDDRSRLNQKQSKNTSTQATITLGLNGVIADSNAANTQQFLNDLTFVAVGDNGGFDCWSNVGLTMAPNPRQWLRVPRQWKITKTGTVGSVAIRITDAPGNFRIPDLPSGATGYVLLLSTNSNFAAAPVPTVIPLVDNGTYLEATLTNAQLATGGGTNYFTIGVQLPLAEYQTLVPCIGDTVTFIGTDILNGGGVCIGFDQPTNTTTLTQNATFTPTNFIALASNSTVGCLDTAQWIVPPTFSGAHYLTTSATCNNVFDFRLINDSIRLGQPLTPDIAIGTVDTVFLCLGDPNVNLVRNSNPGGGLMSIFNYPGSAASTLNGLLDSTSLQLASVGSVYVHSGNLGHHVVTYRYPSGCSSTDSVHIYIGAPTASTYSYANSTLCITDTAGKVATTVPDYVTMGGAFSSIPSGLNLNAGTGRIYANTSSPGAYLATYTPDDSTCGLPVTIPVTVNNPQQTIFDYPTQLCAGTPSVMPTMTTYVPGGTFSITPTTGATVHPNTGKLTLTNSAAGPYHITYTLPGSCVVNYVDSIFVLIKPTVVFPPLGTAGEVCKMTPFVDANAIPVGGNYISSTAAPNLVINGNRIWVDSSTVGGPYVISYIYADANGCLDTASQFLTILPLDSPVVAFPRGGYCTNEPAQTPFFFPPTSTAGVFSSSPAGLNLATNGTLNPAASLGGTYTINFAYTHPACPTPVPVDVIQIAPAVQAGFTLDSAVCFGTGSITLTPDPGAVLDSLQLFYAGNLYPTSSQHVQGSTTILFVGTGGDSLPGDLSYSVVNTVTNTLGCTEQSSGHFQLVADQNSSFDYLEDLYCANTSDPTPFIYGIGGGTFSSPTLTPQTQLDTTTGLLHLLASFSGNNSSDTFHIAYTTAGPCPSTSWDTVYVREGYDSYFQFPLSIVCSSIGTVVPTDLAEDSVGVSGFIQTAGPPLTFNAQTGVISNLQNLNVPPGQTTSITLAHWTGSANNCLDTTTQVMSISMFDTLYGIEYLPNVVCGNQLVPPILSGDTSTSYVNNPIGVTYAVNGFGVVDARFSQPGIHNIVMTDRDVCGERDTAVLEILGLPDASFIYDAPGICTTDSFFTPDSIQTLNGTFSYEGDDSVFNLNLDPVSGVITIQGSDPGLYTVYYSVVSGNGCPNTDSVFVTLSRSPVLRVLEARPGPSVCVNQPVTFASQGDGTVSWFVDNVFTGRTGPIYIDSTLANGQVVKAVLRNTAGCTDSLSIQMEILPPPTVTVVDRPSVITENDPFSIQLQPGQDNTIIAWHATAVGLQIRDTVDTTITVNANDIHAITNVLKLFSDYDPGTIQYWFTPMNNGCIGNETSILIVVNPNGDRVFIPEVMTPNGDGPNDLWEIRYDSDLSPTDYTIEVYNRSGGLVYTVKDLDEKWNGGGNPDGVYWWILRHKSGAAELSGGLTIRRD